MLNPDSSNRGAPVYKLLLSADICVKWCTSNKRFMNWIFHAGERFYLPLLLLLFFFWGGRDLTTEFALKKIGLLFIAHYTLFRSAFTLLGFVFTAIKVYKLNSQCRYNSFTNNKVTSVLLNEGSDPLALCFTQLYIYRNHTHKLFQLAE